MCFLLMDITKTNNARMKSMLRFPSKLAYP